MAEGQTSLGIARGSLLGCNSAISQSAAAEIGSVAPWRRFLTRSARVEVPAQTAEINEVSPKKSPHSVPLDLPTCPPIDDESDLPDERANVYPCMTCVVHTSACCSVRHVFVRPGDA